MKTALLFKDGEKILVTADEIKEGKYSRFEEFVDPEYEFKVQYVRGAKNNGGPYFRLYYSYEDYKKMFPDRADRYQIVANMRRFQECKWHREWKEKVSDFCETEKYHKNPKSGKYKFADAYHAASNTCIEFQHSYIAFDFEERNTFYRELGKNIIWLYDLSSSNIRKTDDGKIEILEDNSRGFFRISEDPDNLRKNFVYIQVKSGLIYRVKELKRKQINSEYLSTIRYFTPSEVYTEEEFINAIKSGKLTVSGKWYEEKKQQTSDSETELKSINELWKPNYISLIIQDITDPEKRIIMVNTNGNGGLYRNRYGCIKYKYISAYAKNIYDRPEYPLSHMEENERKWKYISHTEKRF